MGRDPDTGSATPPPDPGSRHWRRLALAAPLSILAHVLLLLLGRPDYRPVSDHAVEFDVLEPGPPPAAPSEPAAVAEPAPEPLPAPEPAPVPAAEREVSPQVVADAVGVPLRKWDPDGGPPPGPPDGGYPDAGPQVVAALGGVDGGTGDGEGICLHDVFRFASADPGWLLWVSLASFRETAYQRGLADTLGSFGLYKQMAGATGMDPQTEVEGFVVTADDVLDWKTFQVVATYDSGEERLRQRLERSRGSRPGFTWQRTDAGYEAAVPGAFRWHMVGSGRVLAVTHEPGLPPGQAPPPPRPGLATGLAPRAAPTNPYVDAGALDAGTTGSGADTGGGLPAIAAPNRPAHRDWPRQVTCLTAPTAPAPSEAASLELTRLARAHLGPDADGHWPVALLATRDPRALGLGSGQQLPVPFSWAVARAVFADPIRVEGTVRFAGSPEQVAALERQWRQLIAAAARDRFLILAGLGGVFDGLVLEARGSEIRFTLPMTEAQIQAALLFIQLQGEALERRLGPATKPAGKPGPTS